ncbi:MAG TPA: hypothetical protein PK280_00280 [Planctomycetota bacterium]|nr:hypothetical protein [Planctomycetota bacterium]
MIRLSVALSSLALTLAITGARAGEAAPAAPPYQDDPEVVAKLAALGEGESLVLPPVKHMRDGKAIKGEGRDSPYARDYTNKMVWAPERSTALYAGGNHGAGRTNDVWEFHLGSNTWHCLQRAIGGDHAAHKNMLMFMPNKWAKDPDYKLTDKEQPQLDAAKAFWNEFVVLKDGHFVTKEAEAPLLVGHTWDTLVYEPNVKRMIHGTGAHCAGSPILHTKFTGMPLDEVRAKLGKNPKGVPYKTMWTFDPAAKKWEHYASESPLAELRGMGAAMCYIPDWKKTIFYVSAQNVTPQAHAMVTYDALADKWEELKPNGGKGIAGLSNGKLAPGSELQTAYSPKHRKMVAVLEKSTYSYDIDKNEWSKLNDDIPFTAMDCNTVFACDTNAGAFLLADPRANAVAAFDPAANKWEKLSPKGSGMPKPPYCTGKGYYDPKFNVFVVQSAYTGSMWVYRHKKAAEPAGK